MVSRYISTCRTCRTSHALDGEMLEAGGVERYSKNVGVVGCGGFVSVSAVNAAVCLCACRAIKAEMYV